MPSRLNSFPNSAKKKKKKKKDEPFRRIILFLNGKTITILYWIDIPSDLTAEIRNSQSIYTQSMRMQKYMKNFFNPFVQIKKMKNKKLANLHTFKINDMPWCYVSLLQPKINANIGQTKKNKSIRTHAKMTSIEHALRA